MTPRIREILSWYGADNPGTLSNLARLLNHGRLGGSGKLVIGGGATDTLPLAGDQRRIVVGGRAATLTTSGAGRQVAFDVPKGSLFVYSSNLSEEELLRVAGSLQPIDLTDMRKRLGAE